MGTFIKKDLGPSAPAPTTEQIRQWATQHGSWTLKRSIERGYKATGTYLNERLALELPGFVLDNGFGLHPQEIVNPSEKALRCEQQIIETVQQLPQSQQADVCLVWLNNGARVKVESQNPKTKPLFLAVGEAVLIRHWLGRYTVVAPIENLPTATFSAMVRNDIRPLLQS